jgi:integrase
LKQEYVPEDEYLTFDEAGRLLRATVPEWKPFIVVALKTGLRVGELLALKWADVDLVAGHLVVRRTLWRDQEGPPKGGQNRKCRLSDVALATLKAYRHLKSPYVFCGASGARKMRSLAWSGHSRGASHGSVESARQRSSTTHTRLVDSWRTGVDMVRSPHLGSARRISMRSSCDVLGGLVRDGAGERAAASPSS